MLTDRHAIIPVFFGNLLSGLNIGMVAISLPTLVLFFSSNPETIGWILIAYQLATATLNLSFGKLSDTVGRRTLILYGLIVFGFSSGLCAFAAISPEQLIVYRIIQGIGAAMISTAAAAVVTSFFPSSERGKALGLLGISWPLGMGIGPAIGGFLIEYFGWQSIFLLNLPLTGLVFILTIVFLSKDVRQSSVKMFDFPGGITIFISLTSFLLAISYSRSIDAIWLISLVIVSISAFILFILIERKKEEPILDLNLFKSPIFTAYGFGRMIFVFAIISVDFIMPFYLVGILRFSIIQAGLILVAIPITRSIFGPTSGWLSDKIGSRLLCLLASAILAIAVLVLGLSARLPSLTEVFMWLLLVGAARGLFLSPNNSAIMGSVPRNKLGVASGLSATFFSLGAITGIALMGLLLTVWVPDTLRQEVSLWLSGSQTMLNSEVILSVSNGFRTAFIVIAIVSIIAFLVSTVNDRDSKR